jgi:type IV pilus assembly protein PilC
MFSRRIPLSDLIEFCRVLRHSLGAGLTIQRVMQQQSERGRPSLRKLAGRLSDALRKGSSLSDALDVEKDAFPILFLSLVKLGETTGHIAEIFGELEHYYQLELGLRRQFRSQTIMPVLQFVMAVFVLAGLLYVLGLIATMTNSKPLFTIFGLGGGAGSLALLGTVFGSIALAWVLYKGLSRVSRQKVWMDRILLRVPALGSCLRALVMSRFSLALQLTLDTGLSITRALRLALEATGNALFSSRADVVVLALKNGQTLHEALVASDLFSEDFHFLGMVASSEESGRVPEMMKHQAAFYHEEATRRMTTLTKVAGMGVWALCAAFIIWAIFRLANIYFEALNKAM